MGSSAVESENIGKSTAAIQFLGSGYNRIFDVKGIQGALNGFQSRMTIEPLGNLHLERIEMYPSDIERGELLNSVPLAPQETVNISHKEWSVRQQEFEDIVQDYFEGYSGEGVAEKSDIAMSHESQSKHSIALSLGASLSASYSSVTLSATANYNTSSGSDQSVRVITNPSNTDAMRIDYFQLARKWRMDLLRYGLRMTYDTVIPNRGSDIVTKVLDIKALDTKIGQSFSFNLALSAITYNIRRAWSCLTRKW